MREVVFPRRSIRIAQVGDEIVGFAARDGAWLEHLYVKPSLDRQGHRARAARRDRGRGADVTPVLRLYTFECNTGARRFYERNGFTAVEFGDGSTNEEREPDIRYERPIR